VLFENAAQVKFTHVPFAGSPQAAIGTVSGETQVTFGTVPAVQEHVRSGRLRGLAVTSLKRRAALGDLPTVHEAGVPDYEMLIWNAMLAPRGTPAAVITRLNAEVGKILEMPDVREAFSRLGGEAWPSTPEQLGAYMAADWAKMQKVVAQSGAKID
jgi:tripartite-type tricarboxylate transporter receptor subunit TctC